MEERRPKQESDLAARVYTWIGIVGFWWSLLSLAHSMRTTQLFIEKLAEWSEKLAWAAQVLYAAWMPLREALVYITAPLFNWLPWQFDSGERLLVSFCFFTGGWVAKTSLDGLYGVLERRREDDDQQLTYRETALLLARTLPMVLLALLGMYLIQADAEQRWLSPTEYRTAADTETIVACAIAMFASAVPTMFIHVWLRISRADATLAQGAGVGK